MSRQKDALVIAMIALVTLALGLLTIRLMAPQLLGGPGDLRMVQTSTELPVFFDGVFAAEEVEASDWILLDPVTRIRARPFVGFGDGIGPHDLLGFRNNVIPAVAEIVVLGDSQSYGNNAILERNWPSHLVRNLGRPEQSLYNMAVGGWGAVQYHHMFESALAFSPRIIVVAFYTGNDPLDTFLMSYSYDRWSELRPDPTLTGNDAPPAQLLRDEIWAVDLGDRGVMQFSPSYRLASNSAHSAVQAGYEIMARVAERMSESLTVSNNSSTKLVFTIIPTKELVYSGAIDQIGLPTPADYTELLIRERENIEFLSRRLAALEGATYIDVVEPMIAAAMNVRDLYPADVNGHPLSAGYAAIGSALADEVSALVGDRFEGVGAIKTTESGIRVYGVGSRRAVLFPSPALLAANGWSMDNIATINQHSLAGLEILVADHVDLNRFGPTAVGAN